MLWNKNRVSFHTFKLLSAISVGKKKKEEKKGGGSLKCSAPPPPFTSISLVPDSEGYNPKRNENNSCGHFPTKSADKLYENETVMQQLCCTHTWSQTHTHRRHHLKVLISRSESADKQKKSKNSPSYQFLAWLTDRGEITLSKVGY